MKLNLPVLKRILEEYNIHFEIDKSVHLAQYIEYRVPFTRIVLRRVIKIHDLHDIHDIIMMYHELGHVCTVKNAKSRNDAEILAWEWADSALKKDNLFNVKLFNLIKDACLESYGIK